MKRRSSAAGCILRGRGDWKVGLSGRDGEWLEIGEITRRHGLRGAFRVRLFNPDSESLSEIPSYAWRLMTSAGRPLGGLRLLREIGDHLIMKIAGIGDLGRIDELKGARLVVPRELIPVGEDEFLCLDLIGCSVFEANRLLGQVEGVFCGGASEVLVVRDCQQGERMIPFVSDWVRGIDLEKRRIEILC